MKLYTEIEVRKAIKADNWTHSETQILETLTPIELPNNDEIAKYMTSVWFADNMHRECFKLGAIWMKTQILNQNK